MANCWAIPQFWLDKSRLVLISILLALAVVKPVHADPLDEQRELFRQANQALAAGQLQKFKSLSAQLSDYALYPYLVYEELRKRLWKADSAELRAFLAAYPDLPISGDLRRNRLKFLAQGKKWQEFLDFYTVQQDKTLQCYFLQARMHLNHQELLLEDIRSLWLAGESLPQECDPVFDFLYQSDFMTDDLLWQRIRLAMGNNNPALAGYLSRRLSDTERKWGIRWVDTHNNPARWTGAAAFEDTPQAREILVHGITRLARQDVSRALANWESLRNKYTFSEADKGRALRELAIWSARKNLEMATELLDTIETSSVDDTILHWRLVTALANRDWHSLLRWTSGTPPESVTWQRWYYWQGRALEETGRTEEARVFFQKIQDERDYYGFLARDHLAIPYEMNHRELQEQPEAWQEVATFPAVIRARELYHHGMLYAARREWQMMFDALSNYQLQIAAVFAAEWGWHDRAILTLGRAMAYDDLVLRFPVVFEQLLRKYADQRQLDLAWMYALVRAESAFMVDARSVSGALGLMQLMPATGKQTADRIGFRGFENVYLLEADKNVTIGSAYLKQMAEKFNGNLVLATAAYNAGPNAVLSWLPKEVFIMPEIWIEQIPYEETRKYVSRILYFASIYDWRLQQKVIPVKDRMNMIPLRKNLHAANAHCGSKLASVVLNQ